MGRWYLNDNDQLSLAWCGLPEDELAVRACRMESACKVAIIFSISSACCSRPTSSLASSAAKRRGRSLRVRWKDIEQFIQRGPDENPACTYPATQRLTDPVILAFQQRLEVWTLEYQPLQCMGCTRMYHSQHPSSHTRCCL